MKNFLVKSLVLLSVAAIGLVVYSSLISKRRIPLKAETIDELLALPEEEIEVGLGALLIGKEYDPQLDVGKYLRKLDKMADKLRSRIGDQTDPEKVITITNRYIFEEAGYGIREDEREPGGPFLHVDLNRKRASPVLYLTLGEKLGLPLTGVRTPGHGGTFVRYSSGNNNIDIDAAGNGDCFSDLELLSRHPVPNTPAARAYYMRNLTKREVLGCLFVGLGVAYIDENKPEDAVRAYRRALAIIPNDALAWNNLGIASRGKNNELSDAIAAIRKALAIDPNFPEAWFNLALTSYARSDYGHAWSCIHRCRQLGYTPNPKFIQWLSAKMRDPAR
jgi:regulator of sirC expression with transglutaminase-like and TPR domain